MRAALKVAHAVGLALFPGSVFGHVLLGELAGPENPAAFAVLQQAKHASTAALTLPGLMLLALSGAGLAWRDRAVRRSRWLRVKLGLAALVALNGILVLTPAGTAIVAAAGQAAATGVVPPELAGLLARETAFGAVNLLMVLGILVLAAARPRLGPRRGAPCPAA